MNHAEAVRERVIEVTTELIEQYNGDTKRITARMIAEKAQIGLGLINYHFGSKERLITECVQRIIGKIVAGFHMEQEYQTGKDRLTAWAVYVFDFLFEHSAISRISILGDFQSYTAVCNSALTQKGFALALKNEVADADKAMMTFILTAAMQAAFLGSEAVRQLLGYDLHKPKERAAYVKKLLDILFEGGKTVQ